MHNEEPRTEPTTESRQKWFFRGEIEIPYMRWEAATIMHKQMDRHVCSFVNSQADTDAGVAEVMTDNGMIIVCAWVV